MILQPLFYIVFFLSLIRNSLSISIYLGPTEEYCFIEEVPNGIRLCGNYASEWLTEQNFPINMDILTPTNKRIVYTAKDIKGSGTFNFKTIESGKYHICFRAGEPRFYTGNQTNAKFGTADIGTTSYSINRVAGSSGDPTDIKRLRLVQLNMEFTPVVNFNENEDRFNVVARLKESVEDLKADFTYMKDKEIDLRIATRGISITVTAVGVACIFLVIIVTAISTKMIDSIVSKRM